MCGIAGFIDSNHGSRDELHASAARMVATLRHRGPDDSGTWVDPGCGLALGHARLSVLDLSPDGHQPMISACGRYVTVYNGEIYNFKQLRRELEDLGARFRGTSDTEVMLAAISCWGVHQAVRRFNGMFAFAVWDREARELVLGRDRLGEKPLYYGRVGRSWVFASELKAIRAYAGTSPELDTQGLDLLLRHCAIPAPYSIYRGIHKLPPGAMLSIRHARLDAEPQPEAYWSAKTAAEEGAAHPFRGSPAEAVDQLHELLSEAVKLRMQADVPLGAFLSGGIDSSTIVALMQAQHSRPVKTYTIGFWQEEYDEAKHARAVAQHLGTDHTELYVTPEDALAVIPRLPSMFDEPFADSSQIPTFLVSQLARRDVTVSLSGDGGDELFGGYTRYELGRKYARSVGWIPPGARAVLGRLLDGRTQLVPGRYLQRKLRRLVGLLNAPDWESTYAELVSHWGRTERVVLDESEPLTALTDPRRRAALREVTHRMMYCDTVMYLPDDILVKVDRASMAVSLESRVPLLDHRVVELAWRLPLSVKIREGRSKWPLRQILYRYVPREMVERRKMGFGVPLGEWLRGPLREWAEDLLDEHRLAQQGLLRPGPIRRKWAEHLAGTYDWCYHLWDVLMFQAWLDYQRGEAVPAAQQASPVQVG